MIQKFLFVCFLFLGFFSCSKSNTQGRLCVYHTFNAGADGLRVYQVNSDNSKTLVGTLTKYSFNGNVNCDNDGLGGIVCIYAKAGSSVSIHAEMGPEGAPTGTWDYTYTVSSGTDNCNTFELYE